MDKRQLFVFWQFNGDNKSWCNLNCPYCYGGLKEMRHYWNGKIKQWEEAFMRLDAQHGNSGIYFVMSYGEAFGSNGFYECVNMIGEHPNWTLCVITNLSYDPKRLIASKLARGKRVYVIASWHPLGRNDALKAWLQFQKHLLKLKKADIPLLVQYLWYKPQIKLFPEFFRWLDLHDIRVNVRRYLGNIGGVKLPVIHRYVGGKNYPEAYNDSERGYIYSQACPKVAEYGLNLASPKGKDCLAGKDLILVKYNGTVGLCCDCPQVELGNVFNPDFKLQTQLVKCPTSICGGDYGMLHLIDDRFGALPVRLERDNFVSLVEGVKQGSPVPYHKREEMIRWLRKMQLENSV